jgi:hypothetical protein
MNTLSRKSGGTNTWASPLAKFWGGTRPPRGYATVFVCIVGTAVILTFREKIITPVQSNT